MKVLLIAPQPLYTERGSPIAVKQVLEVLSDRGEQVDVLTYHLGEDVVVPGVTFHRIPRIPFVKRVRPGFSGAKILCDLVMVVKMIWMVIRGHYDLVHAVEEGVFMALLLKRLTGKEYVYDMDSSLVQQMVDQFPWLLRCRRVMRQFERAAVQGALAVVPVCPALGDIASGYGQEHVAVIGDVPLQQALGESEPSEDLIETWGIQRPILLYVGNLEPYQGIDLMLESFRDALRQDAQAYLVVVGGDAEKIAHYQAVCRQLRIDAMVRFVGPRPVTMLGNLLEQADILVSPRVHGNNTPMKLYSYLASGRPVIATNMSSHTQVVDARTSMLVEPNAASMSAGMVSLIQDTELRISLGKAGQRLSQGYTFKSFRARLNELYDSLNVALAQEDVAKSLAAPLNGRQAQ